jgi:NAD-dependent deacetylase
MATFVSIRGQTETGPDPGPFGRRRRSRSPRAAVGILGQDGHAERLFIMPPDVTSDGPAGGQAWTRGVSRLAVLTGAGISTDSGIPDFRGPQGVWTRNPAAEKMSTYQAYMGDPGLRRRSWQARLAHPAWAARPNAAHEALARLARSGIDTQVITQNIDGLHLRAGTPAERVVELHGTMFDVVCTGCGERTRMADALDRVRAGEDDPPCAQCGGILKSATVMFGQALEPAVYERAAIAAARCDLLLAIGSTLTVEPAASLCSIAARAGAGLVIVNRDRTPYDPVAAAVIREPIGTAVPKIAEQLLYDEPNSRFRT